jgi:hypothetical protein
MSLKKKLTDAATAAAIEATTNERARCLWCIDQVVKELESKLRTKLMSEQQLHIARTKFQIAQSMATHMRRVIASGVRPQGGPGGTKDTAGLLPTDTGDG